jgi:hypothetical protein
MKDQSAQCNQPFNEKLDSAGLEDNIEEWENEETYI